MHQQQIWEQPGFGEKHQSITTSKLEMVLLENQNHQKISESQHLREDTECGHDEDEGYDASFDGYFSCLSISGGNRCKNERLSKHFLFSGRTKKNSRRENKS